MSKKARPYQIEAIDGIHKAFETSSSTMLVLPTGAGKCLGVGTPILMFDGTIRPVECVRVGDRLMGPDSTPRNVLSLANGVEQMYTVKPVNGLPYTVNESHILSLKLTPEDKGKSHRIANVSVLDYLASNRTFRHRAKGWRASVDFPVQSVILDPYFLGLWLADGTSSHQGIHKPDPEVLATVSAIAEHYGLRLSITQYGDKCPMVSAVSDKGKVNPLMTDLRRLGVLNNKHVPHEYIANDRATRLAILAGLIDGDGCLTHDGCTYEYSSILECLADAVVFLCRSLGLAATKKARDTKCQTGAWCHSFRIHISGNTDMIPCRIERKKAKPRGQKKDATVYGVTVEPIGVGEYYGFEIDGDRLFMLGDFTVTHNTFVAADIMTKWQRGNSLFLAHTRELIEQSAATLAIEMDGIKPIIEMNVQGADQYTIHQGGLIVVGSVQSMYTERRLEKYGKHPFGLIVIDEAHRALGSTYGRILDYFKERNPDLKVLMVTATPTRADGKSLGLVSESVAYQMTINTAIDGGWLVPITQKAVSIEGLDFSNLRTRMNEFGERDFSAEKVEEIIMEEEPMQAFAKSIIELAGERQTLVFMPGVKSAHLIASILRRYKEGSAEGADGETPKELRTDIVKRFRDGKTQFLCNALLYTEGADFPGCSCVAMCRFTKSIGRYIQMLGRALRPLPGTVDGLPDDPFERKMAILKSKKPDALVLDFAGCSEHKLVDVWDVLAGNYDEETIELAETHGDKKNISEDLEKAQMLRQLMLQWDERKKIIADSVKYQAYDVNPFDDSSKFRAASEIKRRGGASDGQVGLLCKLGVARETAEAYSKRQAGAVIQSIGSKRCTDPQAKALRSNGINPEGMSMDRASNVLDALSQNKWKPLTGEQLAAIE